MSTEVIDDDLGSSARHSGTRSGFMTLVAEVGLGRGADEDRRRRPADRHGHGLYRILARRIGNRCENQKPAQLFRKFVNTSASVEITEDEIIVSYGRRAYNPFLAEAGLFETAETLPWLGGRTLRLRAI